MLRSLSAHPGELRGLDYYYTYQVDQLLIQHSHTCNKLEQLLQPRLDKITGIMVRQVHRDDVRFERRGDPWHFATLTKKCIYPGEIV